jgi:hypothetical protein
MKFFVFYSEGLAGAGVKLKKKRSFPCASYLRNAELGYTFQM